MTGIYAGVIGIGLVVAGPYLAGTSHNILLNLYFVKYLQHLGCMCSLLFTIWFEL